LVQTGRREPCTVEIIGRVAHEVCVRVLDKVCLYHSFLHCLVRRRWVSQNTTDTRRESFAFARRERFRFKLSAYRWSQNLNDSWNPVEQSKSLLLPYNRVCTSIRTGLVRFGVKEDGVAFSS
jgi:hypothetical protein